MNDLTLICETCRFPIGENTGCIYVTFTDVNRARRGDLSEIRWRTSHYAHFTEGERDTYEVGSASLRTWPQMARWTAHLMEKNWFGLSDWDDLLRELSGEIPSRRILVVTQEAA